MVMEAIEKAKKMTKEDAEREWQDGPTTWQKYRLSVSLTLCLL